MNASDATAPTSETTPYQTSMPDIPALETMNGVAAIATMIPTNCAREGKAAAVARSVIGNHRAPTLVMAFITNG